MVKVTKYLYETKNWEIKVCKLDLENWKNCGIKDSEQADFYCIYLFMDFNFGIKSHKVEHAFKTYD